MLYWEVSDYKHMLVSVSNLPVQNKHSSGLNLIPCIFLAIVKVRFSSATEFFPVSYGESGGIIEEYYFKVEGVTGLHLRLKSLKARKG
jgi:hypothetical protein